MDPLVLIVDDNEKNRKLTRDVLCAGGFRTIEATSGAEGIALATKHLPDVILMDLRLPDMDGTDVARTLNKGASTSRIPVVALSSLPLQSGGEWLVTAGFAGYLEKPFSVKELPDQVRRYCSQFRVESASRRSEGPASRVEGCQPRATRLPPP